VNVDLRLASIRTRAVSVPIRRPLRTRSGSVERVPLVLIDCEASDGSVGRAYLFTYREAFARAAIALFEDVAEAVIGRPLAPRERATELAARYRLVGHEGLARFVTAGFDMACWDALAIASGLPLATLLGGTPQPVAAYNSNGLSPMAPDDLAVEAESLCEDGFRALKIRLGYETPGDDVAAVRAVRARVGAGVSLMCDYNQSLTFDEALRRGRALDGEGLAWIEEPMRHDDDARNAQLAADLATPIQLGENFAGLRGMERAIAAHACDLVMPDVERIGGITGWLEAAALAAAHDLPMSTHLFPEVGVQLMAVTPTRHYLEYVDWANPILAEPLRISGGLAFPVDAPGSGVAWNDRAVERYAL
jgi:mandelate racemase